MLQKVVGAALLMIGVGLYARLDRWPELQSITPIIASAFFYFGLLVFADGVERSVIAALRDGKGLSDKTAEPGAAADRGRM
jgi:hypothetical protein